MATLDAESARTKFLYNFAYLWSVSTIVYVFCVTFTHIPESNVRIVDTIIGFLMGTIISGLIGYFYGSSHSSSRKDDTIKELAEDSMTK